MGFFQKYQHAAWDTLISYKTQRIILIKDYKLGILHKSLLVGVAIYLLYTILTSHAYMITEAPAATVNSWVDENEFVHKLKETKNGSLDKPWYCDNVQSHYVYSDGFTYLNNECDLEATVGEVFSEESTAVSFVTYYQDSTLEKTGNRGTNVNNFIPYVEDIVFFFSHGFTTSLGIGAANVETLVKSSDGSLTKRFAKGSPIRLKISDMLDMAGIRLDDRHEKSGGQEPSGGFESPNWPLYRMTGIDITLEMEYKNFRSDRIFDFTSKLDVTVTATEGVWVSRGRPIHPKWEDDMLIPYGRYPQVISVSYRPSGQLGKLDAFTAVMNIAVSAAIFGVAKFICDYVGDWIVDEFYDKRYLDHGDHLAIKTLKEMVWDEGNQKERSTRHLVSKALDPSSLRNKEKERERAAEDETTQMHTSPVWSVAPPRNANQLSSSSEN